MQCLLRYRWLKLPRATLPRGKGLLGYWSKLASRAAFRKGIATYCGFENPVTPGMWVGGIVGLKSILGLKNREAAFDILYQLADLGLITHEYQTESKTLSYRITDWVVEHSGAECIPGNVYTTPGYGFLCVPRSITEKLARKNYIFEEADAWLDLWCHTVFREPGNAFSFYAPICQYGKYGVFLTLETLGQRWGWEKTKVWRFLQKQEDVFTLHRLPGSYGCLIFNTLYPCDEEVSVPTEEMITHILDYIRCCSAACVKHESDREHMSRMVVWFSRKYLRAMDLLPSSCCRKRRVALFSSLYRAYISLCWIWKNGGNDCRGCFDREPAKSSPSPIRGPCAVDLSQIAKELFSYG